MYQMMGRSQKIPLPASLVLASLLLGLAGCGSFPKAEAETQAKPPGDKATAVDIAIARPDSLQKQLEYTGTTRPIREVSVRSQVEGQLVSLNVNVGDRVQQGQTLGRLDDALLKSAVRQAEAELAAQESEVDRALADVIDARTQVGRAQAELQQAQADATRSRSLAREGAIPVQKAEQAQTEAQTALQALRSTQAQIGARERSVTTARKRVAAQQAVVNQEAERQSYTTLSSPVTGSVLQRVTEPGNLAQPGTEILRVGDFSQVKISVQVSELEIGTIRAGQPVQVRLDAIPNQQFIGRVMRISPDADATARLIPIEVTIPNTGGRIGSGLLARVNFSQSETQRIVVPQTAVQTPEGQEKSTTATLFTLQQEGDRSQVVARSVTLGKRTNGQVEILSGLKPGEAFVARSSQPLKDGAVVRPSVISEKKGQERS
ncbi:efflux RND transporter periplasmic adaptor subunit [Phormidesmis priestleyi]